MNFWPFKKKILPIGVNTAIDINDPIIPPFIQSIAAAGICSEKPAPGTKVNYVEVDFGCYKFKGRSSSDVKRLIQMVERDLKELLFKCTYICFDVNGNKYCYNAVTDLFEDYSERSSSTNLKHHASTETSHEVILGKDKNEFVYDLPASNHLIFISNIKNNNLYSADIFPHVLAFNGTTILFDELHQGDSLYDNLIKTFKERGGVAKVFDCASNISFKRFFSAINPDNFNSLFLEWVNNEISGILNNITSNTKTLLVFKNSNYLHNDTFINFRIHFNEYYHKNFWRIHR